MLTSYGRRVLIAGCGDVGLRLARRLLVRGIEVHALRRSAQVPDAGGLHWHQGDVGEPPPLPSVDAVVFTATPDTRDEAIYRRVFVHGLARMLDANPDARVVLASSSAVYGNHDGGWVDEDTPPAPPGFNGRVLLEAEALVQGQRGSAVRLAGLYGPGRLQLVERLRAGQARVPRSHPFHVNRIHVDDAASALMHALDDPSPAPVYVGVDDTPLPMHELYDAIAVACGAPLPLEGPPPAGIGSKRLRNHRLRATGWQPAWPDARLGYAALI
jgi:nucleoside-diphosphate-sugar epimerase